MDDIWNQKNLLDAGCWFRCENFDWPLRITPPRGSGDHPLIQVQFSTSISPSFFSKKIKVNKFHFHHFPQYPTFPFLISQLPVMTTRRGSCKYCGQILSSTKNVHERDHETSYLSSSYNCKECRVGFQRTTQFDNHQTIFHPLPQAEADLPIHQDEQPFQNLMEQDPRELDTEQDAEFQDMLPNAQPVNEHLPRLNTVTEPGDPQLTNSDNFVSEEEYEAFHLQADQWVSSGSFDLFQSKEDFLLYQIFEGEGMSKVKTILQIPRKKKRPFHHFLFLNLRFPLKSGNSSSCSFMMTLLTSASFPNLPKPLMGSEKIWTKSQSRNFIPPKFPSFQPGNRVDQHQNISNLKGMAQMMEKVKTAFSIFDQKWELSTISQLRTLQKCFCKIRGYCSLSPIFWFFRFFGFLMLAAPIFSLFNPVHSYQIPRKKSRISWMPHFLYLLNN